MRKIETTLENIVKDIRAFYDPKTYHFLTLNGVPIDKERIEIQWIFSHYSAKDDNIVFYTIMDESQRVPSIVDIIHKLKGIRTKLGIKSTLYCRYYSLCHHISTRASRYVWY